MLTIIGFAAPNVLVLLESMETGNILLYTQPLATLGAMFANRISTIFAIDLLFAVLVFFVWTFTQREALGQRKLGILWASTLLFGLAGAFPLFLFFTAQQPYDKGIH